MKIILISGKAQHGKDTFCGFLQYYFEPIYNIKVIHFADALKFVCQQYYDWNGVKNELGRTILQRVGTDIVRAQDEHFWTDFVARLIKTFKHVDYVIIPDWRFNEEIEQLSKYFDFNDIIKIRVDRGSYVPPEMTNEQLKHKSEVELDDYPFDFIIDNTSDFSQLKDSAEELVRYLKGE